MEKLAIVMCCALIMMLPSLTRLGTFAKAATNPITVPQDFKTIQEAVNNATDGDAIQVSAGTYHENVVVNKTVRLIGENPTSTTIDGGGIGSGFFVNASNVVISGFTVQNCNSGIWIFYAQNCTIDGNNAENNAYGLKLYYSRSSVVRENNVSKNEWFGITLEYSGDCTLRNNVLTDNNFNFGVDGATLHDFVNDIDTSNTVNGNPIYYMLDRNNLTLDISSLPEIGYLAFVNSTNINVKDLTLTRNVQGILLAYTLNSTIENIKTSHNWNGIYLKGSSECRVRGSIADSNFDYGIALRSCGDCTVTGNNVTSNNWGGISLATSWGCTVARNNVTKSYYGIHLVDSTDCTVACNDVGNRNDGYSVVVYRSYDNLIYDNNFVNHFIYAFGRSDNNWDNGLEGNSWTGYSGEDVDPQDGVGDSPYTLDQNNEDRRPLMGTFYDFTVSYEAESYLVNAISNSTISNFNFRTSDDKDPVNTLSFNVTGQEGSMGFCRITIPNALMDGNYTVLVDGSAVFYKKLSCSNSTNSYLYFTYPSAEHEVVIIPEFTRVLILLLTIIVTLLAASDRAAEEREHRKRNNEVFRPCQTHSQR